MYMRSDKSKNNRRIAVIADDRESKSEVIKFLSEIKNVSVDIKRLFLGDYFVDKRLIFERKTLNDFALSIIDGRLFNQAIRLLVYSSMIFVVAGLTTIIGALLTIQNLEYTILVIILWQGLVFLLGMRMGIVKSIIGILVSVIILIFSWLLFIVIIILSSGVKE